MNSNKFCQSLLGSGERYERPKRAEKNNNKKRPREIHWTTLWKSSVRPLIKINLVKLFEPGCVLKIFLPLFLAIENSVTLPFLIYYNICISRPLCWGKLTMGDYCHHRLIPRVKLLKNSRGSWISFYLDKKCLERSVQPPRWSRPRNYPQIDPEIIPN